MRVINNFNISNFNWWNNVSRNNRNDMFSRVGNNSLGQNFANTSVAFRSSVLSISNRSDEMIQTLNTMRGIGKNATSPFQAKRPESDNADALAVRSFDSSKSTGLDLSKLSVDVVQVALSQKNEGPAMIANARATASGFSLGSHKMAITVGDKQFDISFNVSSTDTNRDVQQRIAAAINNVSGIGVTASVSSDAKTGTSSLVLQSATGVNNTGQPNFTVRSVSGNAVAIAGIGEITQEAQNAQFKVNNGSEGTLQTSKSNDVDLGFGLTARLSGTGSAKFAMGRDESAQINAVRNMVNSFNNLMEAAKDSGHGSSLERELNRTAGAFTSTLNRIGVSFDKDGFMRIDADKMNKAAGSGDLEKFGTRDGVSFMNSLSRLSESVKKNPANYASAGNSTSNSFDSGTYTATMQSLRLSRITSMGSLFDMLR